MSWQQFWAVFLAWRSLYALWNPWLQIIGGSKAGTEGENDLQAKLLLLMRLVSNGNSVIRPPATTADPASSLALRHHSPSSMAAFNV
ncbi:hypothetical protein N7513_003047 [Penicillium frequentans]|nr:hypothetical protein N7513_003047 [Penicillium glabrum]